MIELALLAVVFRLLEVAGVLRLYRRLSTLKQVRTARLESLTTWKAAQAKRAA